MTDLPTTLLDLLNNALVLRQLLPYLPVTSALALASSCKPIRSSLYETPDTFRYLDLSHVRSAILPNDGPLDRGGNTFRSQRMDEALTEDDFYSGPLRGIFSKLERQHLLQNVHVLVLDGLSVPAELVQEIISSPRFNVRILSIREAQHLNERQLMQALKYAVRPSRPEGTPRLKGLYLFGLKDSSGPADPREALVNADGSIMSVEGAQIGAEWNQRSQQALSSSLTGIEERVYQPCGRIFRKAPLAAWAEVLVACQGIIAFDAVLCRSPWHDINKQNVETWRAPAVATIALGPSGCEKCHSSPEGPAIVHTSPAHHLPLVGDAPKHSISTAVAQVPRISVGTQLPGLFLRCEDCVRSRWCEKCSRWWCEDCLTLPAGNQRKSEVSAAGGPDFLQPVSTHTKIFMNLCIEHCLVGEMMSGAGSAGM